MTKKILALLCGCLVAVAALSAAANDAQEEKQIMATLNALADATIKRDAKVLNTLVHEDVTYGHSGGEVQNKAEAVEGMLGRGTTTKWYWENVKVTIVGPTAVVRANQTVHYLAPQTKKPMTSSSHVIWVMVKGNGPYGWQVLARQNFRP